MWQQRIISLRPRERGFHLVTEEVLGALPELAQVRVGLLSLWLQHTSASLTVNENADPAVRRDFERFFNRLKQFRRLATRYDKLASRFLAFLHLACAYIWLL